MNANCLLPVMVAECRIHRMNPDEITDHIMDCGCGKSHNDEANEFLMAVCAGLAEIWPKAQGGEFSLRVDDSKGNPVVEFGGIVPRLSSDIGNN